jgi:hypothetical protein
MTDVVSGVSYHRWSLLSLELNMRRREFQMAPYGTLRLRGLRGAEAGHPICIRRQPAAAPFHARIVLSTGVYERLLDRRWTAKPIFTLSI